jgi:glycosyltransferase involved in cell wall biosynthesis
MRIVSYHYGKSTGVGGIESLYRSFQDIALKNNIEYFELYHCSSGTDVNDENEHVEYIKLCDWDRKPRRFTSLLRKICLLLKLFFFDFEDDDNLVIVDLSVLGLLPKRLLSRINIYVIQSNRLDLFVSPSGRRYLNKRWMFIKQFSVYSKFDKEQLITLFPFLESKIKIIPRGCRYKKSESAREYSKKLVTVTRIQESQKNLKEMIDIVKLLPSDFTLDIYGDGPDEEVNDLRLYIGETSKIKFHGVAVNVDEILKNYSIFLMTSNYEGYGQTLIEARSQGLPLIVYDTFPALKSIIDNGVNGYRVRPGDQAEFIEKIEYMASDKEIYNIFSNEALRKASETNMDNIKNIWERTLLE